MALITTERFSKTISVPVSLVQTELRRGSVMKLATVELEAGQSMQLRFLFLNVIRILTPGVLADEVNTGFGLAFCGVYHENDMAASPVGSVIARTTGIHSTSPHYTSDYTTPGSYSVLLWNNTGRTVDGAADLAVSVTGALKITK